jgi:hypothetical protein
VSSPHGSSTNTAAQSETVSTAAANSSATTAVSTFCSVTGYGWRGPSTPSHTPSHPGRSAASPGTRPGAITQECANENSPGEKIRLVRGSRGYLCPHVARQYLLAYGHLALAGGWIPLRPVSETLADCLRTAGDQLRYSIMRAERVSPRRTTALVKSDRHSLAHLSAHRLAMRCPIMSGCAYEVARILLAVRRALSTYDPPKTTDSVVTVPACLPGAPWFCQ